MGVMTTLYRGPLGSGNGLFEEPLASGTHFIRGHFCIPVAPGQKNRDRMGAAEQKRKKTTMKKEVRKKGDGHRRNDPKMLIPGHCAIRELNVRSSRSIWFSQPLMPKN